MHSRRGEAQADDSGASTLSTSHEACTCQCARDESTGISTEEWMDRRLDRHGHTHHIRHGRNSYPVDMRSGMEYAEMLRMTTLDLLLLEYSYKLQHCTLLRSVMTDAMKKSVSNLKSKRDSWRKATGVEKTAAHNALVEEMCAYCIISGDAAMRTSAVSKSYDAEVATATSGVRSVGAQRTTPITRVAASPVPTLAGAKDIQILDCMDSTDEEGEQEPKSGGL